MCNLLTKSTEEKIEGFKIVAKKSKGKRYFSIAIGFRYPLDGHIPVIRKQHRICAKFLSDIISKSSKGYSTNMVGRTAVFLSFAEAAEECRYITRGDVIENGYRLVIVRSEVSVDVMEGTYLACGTVCKVAAGRHINFIEEIDRQSPK